MEKPLYFVSVAAIMAKRRYQCHLKQIEWGDVAAEGTRSKITTHGPTRMFGGCLMQKSTAQMIVDLLLRQTAEQNALIGKIKAEATNADFQAARSMIAHCMGQIFFEALTPIFIEFPELKPDSLE